MSQQRAGSSRGDDTPEDLEKNMWILIIVGKSINIIYLHLKETFLHFTLPMSLMQLKYLPEAKHGKCHYDEVT